ncbi:MAG: hypothetical protein MUC62_01390 [Candidatus Thermoplasmatota archaeon]|jgi:hypothetical protein|nr:hypothetical protein [Candidatus Thermoplasmatota archaeon]
MGNECEGSLSPQADLIGFAVAIMLAASLALLLSSIIEEDGPGRGNDVSAEDVRSLLDWPGFDPDDDGVLTSPMEGSHLTGRTTGTDGEMVAVLSTREWSESCLFTDGRYTGNATGLEPCSTVRSMTVLIMIDGVIKPGTLTVFRTEGGV